MQTTFKTIPLENVPAITKRFFTLDTLLFDIETTGFSAKKSDLYLIGLCYRKEDHAVVEQFLADDASEQSQVLDRFTERLKKHKIILTYNGTGFDLPYLKEKLHALAPSLHAAPALLCAPASPDLFASHTIRDLYKDLTPLRAFLGLPNLRQKTVEGFLRLTREDTYSGGDLIPIYRHYAATHDDLPKELLLLHNYEDVLGMLKLIPVLSYPAFLGGAYDIRSAHISPGEKNLQVLLTPEDPFPVRVESVCDPFSFVADENTAILTVQLYQGELKYFFSDPENYYYLPDEDVAIHRSVGNYVDRGHRIPARKSNCYIKKSGVFIPQPGEIYSPALRNAYKDPLTYYELPKAPDLESDVFRRYIDACLRHLIQNAKKSGT